MTISAADMAASAQLDAMTPDYFDGPPDLTPLATVESVLGYIVAWSRSQGHNEVDMVEMTVRLAGLDPGTVRRSAAILGRLGYGLVADRLHAVAGRRRNHLWPLT